ncbi:MAG: glycosyltransferase family 1 protein, partial [Balneolaceae bacterium]
MKTFRIALFTGNYNHIRDGVSLTLNRLVKFLEDAGMDVLVFSPTVDNPALKHNGRMVDVPSVSLPGRPEYRMTVSFSKKAKMELETFDPDIIHIATPDFLGYKALKWAVKNNKIIVSSFHTHFTSYLKYYRLQFLEFFAWRYLRWFYSHVHQIYVPTPSMADNLKENGFEGDLRIWARGVDTTLFSPSRRDEEWRERQGFRPEDVVVTLVSRLVWEKNLEIFATTVKRVMEKYSHVKPLVVGAGPARQKLSEMLPEAVYTGFLTGQDLAKAYASSDIFFFPSDTESFGNVTLEAMSSGLPCIV